MNYRNGQLHGELAYWYMNHQRSYQSYYVDGKKNGKEFLWDDEGHVIVERVWDHDALIENCHLNGGHPKRQCCIFSFLFFFW